jgi:hypothetical protein
VDTFGLESPRIGPHISRNPNRNYSGEGLSIPATPQETCGYRLDISPSEADELIDLYLTRSRVSCPCYTGRGSTRSLLQALIPLVNGTQILRQSRLCSSIPCLGFQPDSVQIQLLSISPLVKEVIFSSSAPCWSTMKCGKTSRMAFLR